MNIQTDSHTRLRYCVSSCFKYLSCSSKVLAT